MAYIIIIIKFSFLQALTSPSKSTKPSYGLNSSNCPELCLSLKEIDINLADDKDTSKGVVKVTPLAQTGISFERANSR